MSKSDFKKHFVGEGLEYLRDNDFAEMDNDRLKKAILTAKRMQEVIDEELQSVTVDSPTPEKVDFSSESKSSSSRTNKSNKKQKKKYNDFE